MQACRHYYLWLTIALLLAVILPRLAAIGDFISMDEGYHAFMASYIHASYAQGQGFPAEMSGYKLYPYLLHWVWVLPGNPVIWLRLADLLVATAMGYVFIKMLAEESGNRWIGLLLGFSFLIGLNYAGAIHNGFKNSFFPAFLCLCCAVNLARRAPPSSGRWIWAGALTGLAVLFRETFVLFPVIGAFALLFSKNYKALWRYIAGGLCAALAITLISMLMRSQMWNLFDFYFSYGKIYGPEAGKRMLKFLQNGGRALVIYSPLLIMAGIGAAGLVGSHRSFSIGRLGFWLACSCAPLVEPYLKIGFLYHFSACLPPLGGLCAFCYACLPQNRGRRPRIYQWAACLCALAMFPYTLPQYAKMPTTLLTLRAFPEKHWPASLADKSTTLEAAKSIQELLKPGATVSSSGFAYFIFPASGTLPPALSLGDLSRTFIYANENGDKFVQALNANEPDMALLAKTREDHSATFYPELKDIFEKHPDYIFYKSIEPNQDKNYGWLGYDIYIKHSSKNLQAPAHLR